MTQVTTPLLDLASDELIGLSPSEIKAVIVKELAPFNLEVSDVEKVPYSWPFVRLSGERDDVVRALLEWYGADEEDIDIYIQDEQGK